MTIRPQRLQLSRAKGFNLQAASRALNGLDAVKVDRTTPWGNPFIVSIDGMASRCVELHRALLSGLVALNAGPPLLDQERYRARVLDELPSLRGKNLACWCKPGAPCHADVLLELANPPVVDREVATEGLDGDIG